LKKLLLAALFLAAAVFGYQYILKQEADEARGVLAESTFVRFDDREVQAVVVDAYGQSGRFELQGDGWQLVDPVQDVASEAGIYRLISRVRSTKVSERIEDPGPLSDYGLNPAAVRIKLELENQTVEFAVGNISPDGDGAFLQFAGDPGITIVDALSGSDYARWTIERLRDDTITGLSRPSIRQMKINFADESATFVRGPDTWQLTEPLVLPASSTRIEGLFDVLFDAKVVQYFDGVMESSNDMFQPDLTIELQGETTRKILIGGSAGGDDRYVRRDDRAPLMRANFVKGVQWPTSYLDYVSSKWTGINRYSVKGISFKAPEGTGSLQRTEDGWEGNDGRSHNEAAVLAWLVRLLGCEVSAWAADDATDYRPGYQVTLDLDQGDPVTLSWIPGRGGRSTATPGVHASFDRDPPSPPGDWF
jgi:hypothetical protein